MDTHDQPQAGKVAKSSGEAKKKETRKRRLRIVFDTNVLYTGSASDLVRQEVATLIQQSQYRDLDVTWYLPEIVRHERQYQMQRRALEMLPSIEKLERLLGHKLNITEEILLDRVDRAVEQRRNDLGLEFLGIEYGLVDWSRLVLDAAYRRPPFETGDAEKGFRDALVAETFMLLVADSPKTPQTCRVVLVTGDRLLREAVEARIGDAKNVRVVADMEGLKELINALASEVEEEFVASLRERVASLFFGKGDKASLYYRERIQDRITEQFMTDLNALPQGATRRKNCAWRICPPNFFKKVRQRVHWVSRIQIEAEATKEVFECRGRYDESSVRLPTLKIGTGDNPLASLGSPNPLIVKSTELTAAKETGGLSVTLSSPFLEGAASCLGFLRSSQWPSSLSEQLLAAPEHRTVLTHKGVDVFEVHWSVGVTTSLALRKPSIDNIVHVEPVWAQVN